MRLNIFFLSFEIMYSFPYLYVCNFRFTPVLVFISFLNTLLFHSIFFFHPPPFVLFALFVVSPLSSSRISTFYFFFHSIPFVAFPRFCSVHSCTSSHSPFLPFFSNIALVPCSHWYLAPSPLILSLTWRDQPFVSFPLSFPPSSSLPASFPFCSTF